MYDLNLTVPDFNSPKYSDISKFRLLKDYLYQLNEVLSFALSDKESSVIKTEIERTQKDLKDKASQMLVLKKESLERFEELKADIIRTADEICTAYATDIERSEREIIQRASAEFVAEKDYEEYKNSISTQIEQNADRITLNSEANEAIVSELEEFKKSTNAQFTLQSDGILSQVENIFTAKTEMDELEERIASKIIQEADNVTESFNQSVSVLGEDISSIGGQVAQFISELDVYIRRGLLEENIYGIEIGRSDSDIKARFTNDRLSFYQGSVEVAYISGSNLYITKAQILDYFKLGNESDGYFIFDTTNKGLEVRWSDGN